MQIPARIILGALLLAIMGQVHAFPTPQKTAPNGVPIMYIEQPNATGLSYNRLDSFNVGPKGLIINNWIADSAPPWNSFNRHSQLGGTILANWKLQQNSARVILNEVTGSTPSQLLGPIEIAGDKADLIIANPNGLVIDGARFINIGRMTLSTGRPTFNTNGSLQTLNVTGGDITINGDRFDTKGADSFDLYAQALKINGKLYAHALSLRLGSQSIDYSSGTASPNGQPNPRLMLLDSSRLGGMYADRITLVGSGVGLGVKLPWEVQVSDNVQISVEGEIQFLDTFLDTENLAIGGDLTLQASSIDLPRFVKVDGNAQFIAKGDLRTHALVVGTTTDGGNLRLEADELYNDDLVTVNGDIELQIEHRWHYNKNGRIVTPSGDVRITTSAARIRLPQKTRSDDCGRNCEDLDIVTADIMRRADAEASRPNWKQPDSVALVIENLETLRNINVVDSGVVAFVPRVRVTDNTPPGDLDVLTAGVWYGVPLFLNTALLGYLDALPGDLDLVVFTTHETEHWRNKYHNKVLKDTTTKTNQEDFSGYDNLWDLPKFK